jgi:hypothetical protein
MLVMRSQRVAVFLGGAAVAAMAALAGEGVTPLSAQAAGDPAKGAAVLAEARQALGGDKLAEVKRLQAGGTIRRGAGAVNLEGDLEFFIELPHKFRRNENLLVNAAGQEIERKEVVDGASSWEETKRGGGNLDFGGGGGGDFGGGGGDAGGGAAGGGAAGGGDAGGGGRAGGQPAAAGGGAPGGGAAAGAAVSPEAQNQARQTEFARVLLALLLTSDTPVNWIGTAKSPDGEADVVEIKTADGTATRLLIDAKTRMPLMLTWTGVPQDAFATLVGRAGFGGRGGRGGRGGFGGQGRGGAPGAGGQDPAQGRRGGGPPSTEPTMLQMFLSDYRPVNGVKLPHLMTRGANGEISEEWIVKNYRVNPNFKADTFSK